MSKKQTIKEELELYDGQRAVDKKVTTDYIPNLRISAKGREIFALSENLYGKWLETQQDFSLIDRAIEFCREAVKLGYPHAVAKMGYYYDKDYVDSDRTEEYRCRVATDYYSKIVYADRAPVADNGASADLTWEELKKMTAKMLLEMLAGSNIALSRDAQDTYGYPYNKNRIAAMFPDIHIAEASSANNRNKDSIKSLQEVLNSCKNNKTRAPLFGVVKMTVAEMLTVFSKDGFGWRDSRYINIWLICDKFLQKAAPTDKFDQNLKKTFSDDNSKGLTAWVCFFNIGQGGHRYVNEKNREAICEEFRKNDFFVFRELIKFAELQSRNMLVFSDDDIEFYNNRNPLDAARKLIENVTKGK
ncbi:MAG: hypothetical protein ACI4VK_04540 [Candidatus Coproplasma sp.]